MRRHINDEKKYLKETEKELAHFTKEIARITEEEGKTTDTTTRRELKIQLKINQSAEVNAKQIITDQTAIITELEEQFKVRQEEMNIQAEVEGIYSQLNTIYLAQNSNWHATDLLYQELYELDPEDPLNIERINKLENSIRLNEEQNEKLQKKHDELYAEIDRLNNKRYLKEQEAEAQKQAAEQEAARVAKVEEVKVAEQAVKDIAGEISFYESRVLNADTDEKRNKAQENLDHLLEVKAELERNVSNLKGDLARADEEAKKAAQAKAEMQQLATLKAEVDRILVTWEPLEKQWNDSGDELDMLLAMAETDPSIDNGERIGELEALREKLGPEYDREKAIYDKAAKAL